MASFQSQLFSLYHVILVPPSVPVSLDVVNFMFYMSCVEESTNVLEVGIQDELIFSEMNGYVANITTFRYSKMLL